MDKDYFANTILENRTRFRKINRMEPDWLYRLRKESWQFYNDSPLPDRSTNVWRYTDPNIFLIEDAGNYTSNLPKPNETSMSSLYSDDLADKGVIIGNLNDALREDGEVAEKYFGQVVGSSFGKFEALNLSLWNSGIFLYIPKNITINKPIHLQRHFSEKDRFQRLLIVAGENVQATIIDDYSAGDNSPVDTANNVVELFADDAANVRYVNIQRFGSKSKNYITSRAQLEKNTNLNSVFASVGSGLTKANLGTILNGRGGNSQMNGIIFGNGKQHFDYHTAQHHRAGESFSNLNFKVVLKERARSIYTGLIRIEKDTANCQAYQENRNLLLNPGTKADSIPELEILTDQVICTHGATMGPIDPEMVFYLKSRCLSEAEAVHMIVKGFVEPMLREMPLEIGNLMRNLVEEKLIGG